MAAGCRARARSRSLWPGGGWGCGGESFRLGGQCGAESGEQDVESAFEFFGGAVVGGPAATAWSPPHPAAQTAATQYDLQLRSASPKLWRLTRDAVPARRPASRVNFIQKWLSFPTCGHEDGGRSSLRPGPTRRAGHAAVRARHTRTTPVALPPLSMAHVAAGKQRETTTPPAGTARKLCSSRPRTHQRVVGPARPHTTSRGVASRLRRLLTGPCNDGAAACGARRIRAAGAGSPMTTR